MKNTLKLVAGLALSGLFLTAHAQTTPVSPTSTPLPSGRNDQTQMTDGGMKDGSMKDGKMQGGKMHGGKMSKSKMHGKMHKEKMGDDKMKTKM